MQVGEAVDVAVVTERHDESCYFCNAKDEPKEETNELDESYPEDDDLDGLEPGGIKFKNDAGKLGTALGGKPGTKDVRLNGKDYAVSVAAHHLIPGNASLKESELFKSEQYLWTNGKAKGNIGYDINSAPNGEWLPGNYAMRPWGTGGKAFQATSGVEPKQYAFAAIEAWRAQFHDAHEKYSTFVTSVLDKLCDKLDENEDVWCPEAKKKDESPESRTPLYVIVNRLHTISGRMRRMLVFPTSGWKSNIFTSAFSKAYISERPHQE
jgi:hypothetical protein